MWITKRYFELHEDLVTQIITPRRFPASPIYAAPIEANVKPDQITAKLEGEGNVNVTIRVEPGSELLRAIEAAKSVSSKGNLKLNVGTSMPESSPAGRGAQ